MALVKVTSVQKDFCVVETVKNGGRTSNIRNGNKIRPVTKKEAEDLKKNVFSSKAKAEKNKKKK